MAHSLLGQIAIFNGRLDEGIELTEREIALNPANAMALYQLGDARVSQPSGTRVSRRCRNRSGSTRTTALHISSSDAPT